MSRERRLEGRVALITGAMSGLGRAMAVRFAREGASVMCADVRTAPDPETGGPVHEAIESEGLSARFVQCDVSHGHAVRDALAATVDAFGRIDIAVANAGVSFASCDLMDEPLEAYERSVAVNQTGVWWTCREASRQMIAQGDGGRIIVTVSVAGLVAFPWSIAYNASKGGAMQIVRTLAAQVATHGITVNAICPGCVTTEMTREGHRDPERRRQLLGLHPLGRLGEPEDIAGAAFFLASDDAAWVTGVALPVDGGYTCV